MSESEVKISRVQQPSGATQWNNSAPSDEESSHCQALDKALPGNVCLIVVSFCSLSESTISVPGSLASQNVSGVNYQNTASVMAQISESWWLEHESCKYMLTIFFIRTTRTFLPIPPHFLQVALERI